MRARLSFAIACLSVACCTHKSATDTGTGNTSAPVPTPAAAGLHAIVYRTRVDVGDAVPITLSEDGKQVTSYPHPSDLPTPDGYPIPTPLGQGYLLDNRGVGLQTAFLRLSYADYAALEKPPTIEELLGLVEYRDPFTEMCDCGLRSGYSDLHGELSEIVRSGHLRTRCKPLK